MRETREHGEAGYLRVGRPLAAPKALSATDDMQAVPAAQQLADLVSAIAERHDRQAFVVLFKHFGPRLKTFFMRAGSSPSVAEDLVQETMLTVWRKASYFDADRAGVSTWLFTIARNLRIDQLRRQKKPVMLPHEPEELEDSAEVHVLGAERDEIVRQALVGLPEEQAEIIRLSYYAEMTQSEIAGQLGIPLGTVKSRARLAMNRLRTLLEEQK